MRSRPRIGRDTYLSNCPDCRREWLAQRKELVERISRAEVCIRGPRKDRITLVLKISEAHGILRALRAKP